MTNLLPNMQAALVEVRDRVGNILGRGYLISPWNSFFQQFTQPAPAIVNVTLNPFTANANGTVIIIGSTTLTLTRGTISIDLTGQYQVPISIGDTVSWTGVPTSIQFLGD